MTATAHPVTGIDRVVYQRRRRNGGDGETVRVYVFKGFYAVVDASDAERVTQYDWYLVSSNQTVYARTGSSRVGASQRLMHRFIIGAKPGEIVDHINGDGLDNRRENLRLVTAAENAANKFDHPRKDRSRGGEFQPTPFQQRPNGSALRSKRLRRMRADQKRQQDIAALRTT